MGDINQSRTNRGKRSFHEKGMRVYSGIQGETGVGDPAGVADDQSD